MSQPSFLEMVYNPDGLISTDSLTEGLHITKAELALATGLSRDAVSKRNRLASHSTQARLRDVIEIMNRILPWTGSMAAAFAWYRSQPLPSFGDVTAEQLIKQGRAEAVKRYLDRITLGGYA